MAKSESRALKEALDVALAAAEAAGDTLIAAKIVDCLWVLSRRAEDKDA